MKVLQFIITLIMALVTAGICTKKPNSYNEYYLIALNWTASHLSKNHFVLETFIFLSSSAPSGYLEQWDTLHTRFRKDKIVLTCIVSSRKQICESNGLQINHLHLHY